MSTTADMNVEIDPAIRADPDLLRAVTAATEYLATLAAPLMPPPAAVRWRVIGDALELALSDDTRPERYPAARTARAARMGGRYDRETLVRFTWIDLVTVRQKASRARSDRLYAEYMQENPDGE